MLRKDVVRLAKKHKFLMYIMRKVANRKKGMEKDAVTATKESVDAPVGITLTKEPFEEAPIVISKLEDDSIFAGTALKPGYTLLSVNGIDVVGQTATAAITPIIRTTMTVAEDDEYLSCYREKTIEDWDALWDVKIILACFGEEPLWVPWKRGP